MLFMFLDVYHTIVLFEVGYIHSAYAERQGTIVLPYQMVKYFDIVHMAFFLYFILVNVQNTMVKYGCRYGNHSVPCFITKYGITF